jgi:hypothetical protein
MDTEPDDWRRHPVPAYSILDGRKGVLSVTRRWEAHEVGQS